MKTYILRNSKSVDARKKTVSLLLPTPAPAAVLNAAGPVLYIGLDVHNDTIAVSLAPSDSTKVRRYGIIGGTHDDVLKLCKKLQGAHPGTELRFCYEAGPRG